MRQPNVRLLLGLSLLLALGLDVWLSTGLLSPGPLAAPTVGAPVASPSAIPVGRATVLTVTSQILDPTLIPTSVNLVRVDANQRVIATLGTMRDDGTSGDAAAGDKIFTLRLSVTEPMPGEMRLQVSAAFRGLLQRVLSPVTSLSLVLPPVANAGPDQTVFVSDTVQLSGSQSSDVDGHRLTFQWTFVTRPPDSTASISASTDVRPTFVVDRPGNYAVQLVVRDGLVESAPDTVVISTHNSSPVANAGLDQTVRVGDMVQLNGSQSSDVDGDPLTRL